jgi:hypothetical protein
LLHRDIGKQLHAGEHNPLPLGPAEYHDQLGLIAGGITSPPDC